jgi:hypothetical protein
MDNCQLAHDVEDTVLIPLTGLVSLGLRGSKALSIVSRLKLEIFQGLNLQNLGGDPHYDDVVHITDIRVLNRATGLTSLKLGANLEFSKPGWHIDQLGHVISKMTALRCLDLGFAG